MANQTWEQIVGAVAVILVMIGAYNTIMSAIRTAREEKKRRNAPVDSLERKVDELGAKVNTHEGMLARDKTRFDQQEEQNRIFLRAMKALLSHEVNGNSTDKLKASMEEIDQFLIER